MHYRVNGEEILMCKDEKYLSLGIDKPGRNVIEYGCNYAVHAVTTNSGYRERKGKPIGRWGRKAMGPLLNKDSRAADSAR